VPEARIGLIIATTGGSCSISATFVDKSAEDRRRAELAIACLSARPLHPGLAFFLLCIWVCDLFILFQPWSWAFPASVLPVWPTPGSRAQPRKVIYRSCAADSDGHCIPGVANPASPQGSGAGLCLCPSNHPVLELAPVSVGAEFGIGALQFVVGGLGAVGAGLGSLFLTRGNDAAIPLSMLFVPLVTTTAVWGVGHLSPSYEPRFGYTLLGAFLGTVVGTAIGYAATRSMKLDLEEPNSTAPFGASGER